MDKTNIYVPIDKVDEEKRLVYGYASTESLDSDGEIVKLEAVEKALPEYMKFGNIREMHERSAVGKAVLAEVDVEGKNGKKGLYLVSKVVDDAAWNKVKEGVYNGYSIGGVRLKKGNELHDIKITEISLVDRPSNPDATFELWKMEDKPAEEKIEKNVRTASELTNLGTRLYWIIDYYRYLGKTTTELETALEQIKTAAGKELLEGEKYSKDVEEAIAMAGKTVDLEKQFITNKVESMEKTEERLNKVEQQVNQINENLNTGFAAINQTLEKMAKAGDTTPAPVNKVEGEDKTEKLAKEVESLKELMQKVANTPQAPKAVAPFVPVQKTIGPTLPADEANAKLEKIDAEIHALHKKFQTGEYSAADQARAVELANEAGVIEQQIKGKYLEFEAIAPQA